VIRVLHRGGILWSRFVLYKASVLHGSFVLHVMVHLSEKVCPIYWHASGERSEQ
jgi:hypothetical protein